jgi:Flp pilus assembly protein TadG
MLRMARGRWSRSFRLYRKNADGVTVIEFAILSPLFFFMLFALFETGLMLFTEYVLQSSVQEAARIVRTGQAQAASMTVADFKQRVCRLAKGIIDCDGKVTVYLNASNTFTTLNAVTPAATGVGVLPDGTVPPVTFVCGQPNQAVALIATYDWQFGVPWVMQYFGNIQGGKARRLTGLAMFKNEPFPAPPAGSGC